MIAENMSRPISRKNVANLGRGRTRDLLASNRMRIQLSHRGWPFFHVFSCLLYYCCIQWILSSIVITLLGKWQLNSFLFFGLCLVYCLPLGVIGRQRSVIVAVPGHLLYFFFNNRLNSDIFRLKKNAHQEANITRKRPIEAI